MAEIQIGKHQVGTGHEPYILAELGLNHNGDLSTCLRMVDAAREAGVHGIKLQSYFTEEFILPGGPGFEIFKGCELSVSDTERVMRHCREVGVDFLSTPLCLSWVRILSDLNVDAFKVASPDITWFDLLRKIAVMEKPTILSTGMATPQEIETVLKQPFLQDVDVILLHCISNYPPRLEDVHLRFIQKLARMHSGPVGFSDHSLGTSQAVASVALGASFIEKHFTLDKDMEGPDHRMSLNPQEFRELCRGVKEVHRALGSKTKPLIEAEAPVREIARRGLWLRNLTEGEVALSEDSALWLRPPNGVDPMEVSLLTGKAMVAMGTESCNVGKHGVVSDTE